MHATSIADNAVGKPTPFRNPFRMLIHPEPWLALIFALTSFVIGLIWFVLHVTFFSIGVSLIFALFGIPILVAWLYVWVWGASLERARVRALLGVEIREPYKPLPEGSWFSRFLAKIQDRHVWLDLLYTVLLFPIGLAEFTIVIVVISVAATAITAPLWAAFGGWEVDTGWWALDSDPIGATIVFLIGCLFLFGMPYVFVGMGRGHAWLARHLLGTDREAELTARVSQLTESRGRALESAVIDLRRIERDLHDGAQQRLVKLSMDLGLAREMLDTDPEKARELIAEAHEEAKRAMNEIRDLA
ncbi:MAG TPA: sensor domain-containing protein, partial [Thermomicrobiales bacterium]|nr:sensor domain-containing protein [Thermomicrobiales bacterium]